MPLLRNSLIYSYNKKMIFAISKNIFLFFYSFIHRRRINTEEKAKVVAAG